MNKPVQIPDAASKEPKASSAVQPRLGLSQIALTIPRYGLVAGIVRYAPAARAS